MLSMCLAIYALLCWIKAREEDKREEMCVHLAGPPISCYGWKFPSLRSRRGSN